MHSTQRRLLRTARKLACDCGGGDQIVDSIEAVWQDPTQFSLSKNGPPYFKLASEDDRAGIVKEAAERAGTAKELLNWVASWDTVEAPYAPLVHLLVIYKAVFHIHQTHHWLTSGPSYYGDHLLFQRLYEELDDLIDGIAERSIGLNGPIVDPVDLAMRIGMVVKFIYPQDPNMDPSELAERSRSVVLMGIQAIRVVIEHLKSKDLMTAGLDDLLPAHAGVFESHAYLTRQRVS